jgi:hypothetical protein
MALPNVSFPRQFLLQLLSYGFYDDVSSFFSTARPDRVLSDYVSNYDTLQPRTSSPKTEHQYLQQPCTVSTEKVLAVSKVGAEYGAGSPQFFPRIKGFATYGHSGRVDSFIRKGGHDVCSGWWA